ncbi:hypothetical protein [Micromonospora sp. NPDC004704]
MDRIERVRRPWRRWRTHRYERGALGYSSSGFHPYAIHLANRSVDRWRPFATRYPARLARALAVQAACLHARGRTEQASSALDECLDLCARAHGPAASPDLRRAAYLLARTGRPDDALTLIERVVGEARSGPPGELTHALVEYGRQLVLHQRFGDAVAVLLETVTRDAPGNAAETQGRYLLLVALGESGRYDELERYAARDLPQFAKLARLNVIERKRYVSLLAALARYRSAAGGETRGRDTETVLRTQRDILHRQLARRTSMWRGIGTLLRQKPDRDTRLANQAERLEAAVAAEVAEVGRLREAGDSPALADALAALAEARWRTGGQRSEALTVQREVVDLTRRLARQDPAGSATPLVDRLRRFAEWAEVVGLHGDARAARDEADSWSAGNHRAGDS